ncbi:MAG: IS6 family transposase [Flavobacteriaceae bacterium]|nr:IS6 family transposase [Flavobacteriaceae bacterium]
MFKGHSFPRSIILQALYFKFRFGLSYRDIEELMTIRVVKVESAKRTLLGIKIVQMIKKQQLICNRKSIFKSFYSLAV